MEREKKMQIANFNLTFGKENEPLLNHFEEILYPSLKKKESDSTSENYYNLENIGIYFENDVFLLAGLIVKSTTLEIYSKYNDEGELKNTDQKIPTDPYSIFIINLKNHRLAFVKNQKGSPTLKDLQKCISSSIKQYIKKTELNKFQPNLNVVSIPHSGKIEDELKKVEKIEQLTLRFYPLNGDVSSNKVFNNLRELLEDVDSQSGNTTINSPKDIDEVGNVLEETKGLVKPTLRVIYGNKAKRTLKENDFSKEVIIRLDNDQDVETNIKQISLKAEDDLDYIETSEENGDIYKRNLSKLEKILRKGR